MSEPLEKGTVKHFLEFITGGEGRKEISEPVNFDSGNFVVKQDDGRYGRDVSFAGGSVDFQFFNKTFGNGLTHEFILIQEYFRRYGFESEIKYILQIDGVDYVIGVFDFEQCTGDQVEFFACKIIQENEQATIKRRLKVKVDLNSDEDLDGNAITPISKDNILIQAKPTTKKNEYVLTRANGFGQRTNAVFYEGRHNFYHSVTKTEILNVHVPGFFTPDNLFQLNDSYLIEAERSLKNLKLIVENVKLRYSIRDNRTITNFPITFGAVVGSEVTTLGATLAYDDNKVDITSNFNPSGVEIRDTYNYNLYEATINLELDLDIEVVAGQKIWIFFDLENATGSGDFGDEDRLTFIENEGLITIQAAETGLSSITKSIRLIDAMKQVCLSLGGFTVDAPRFDVGGEFYDQRVFDGNQLRGFDDKPFYLSFEDIIDHIKEFNADYEITSNGNIFFGIYDDFYTDNEIAVFDILPNESFEKSFNPRYAVNKYSFKYKKFEEDRDEKDTLDSVHTNTQSLLPNIQVENEKEIEVPFIRDPLLIESTRVRSIEVNETTSLEVDNDIFIIDSITTAAGFAFTEILVLNHSIEDDGTVKLINDGSFSWLRIGLQITADSSSFSLNNVNIQNYTILDVKDTILILDPDAAISNQQTGLLSTSFTYRLLSVTIKNRANEGFDLVSGLLDNDGFSNINFTPKRNTLNYWGAYLNTCCQYKRDGIIKNTFFKNNKGLTTQKPGEANPIVEGDDINVSDLKDRILTPVFYKTEVISTQSMLNNLIVNLRDQRGYVTIKDNRREDIKVHPSSLDFQWAENRLIIEGEERYQVIDFLTINISQGIYTIQQIGFDDIVTETLIPEIQGENVLLFDKEMLLLTYPIKYFNISVNGVIGNTPSETLDLIKD